MNIRDAILKAADQIERHPETFDFMAMMPDCGSPGCAIGWVLHFAGARSGSERYDGSRCFHYDDLNRLLGVGTASDTYPRLDALSSEWTKDAKECARALRLYADKYHPVSKLETVPFPTVMAMFDTKVADPDEVVA